ncbi:hypothetical protein ACEPAI_3918 [Sanghuangporus weigelae]
MVFTNLGQHEKQAFFDLLDEYFSSRPELFSSLGGTASGGQAGDANGTHANAAASAVHKALASNPEATANLISSGLRHGSQSSSVKNSPFASAASNPAIANSVGRVAAASLAFQHRNANNASPPAPPAAPARGTPPPPPAPRSMPPALPRRTSSTSASPPQEYEHAQEDEGSPPPPPGRPPIPKKTTSATGLVAKKSIGNIDTSSLGSSVRSMVVKNNDNRPLAPPVPPAFPKRQHNFAPPPMRRLTSDSSPAPPARAPRTPTPEPEPEPEGEWAEALYDYDSGEAGDLPLREHARVKIVSRDSEDWWTGELNGKTGLFPASYVRVL